MTLHYIIQNDGARDLVIPPPGYHPWVSERCKLYAKEAELCGISIRCCHHSLQNSPAEMASSALMHGVQESAAAVISLADTINQGA